jgi:hypothetical protein
MPKYYRFRAYTWGKQKNLEAQPEGNSIYDAISEIRRKDRRGVTLQRIFYMAMEILRLRFCEDCMPLSDV